MDKLYVHTETIHNFSAPSEVVPIVLGLINVKSVLDVGCGIGTWLKIFEDHGIKDYLGVDGDYVDSILLKIPPTKFLAHDLTKNLDLDRKYDLVISLEVAEHLPESVAELFVQTLVSHGNSILFSAALPGQGGQRHLNEQWPSYWQKKFEKHGFYFHDVIRPKIWENTKIDWWYRQNIFLITKEISSSSLHPSIHPECFKHQITTLEEYNKLITEGGLGIFKSLKILLRSFKRIFL